jgi:hypothetical protein
MFITIRAVIVITVMAGVNITGAMVIASMMMTMINSVRSRSMTSDFRNQANLC